MVVKPSARRARPEVGAWVADHGPRRTFESKALAREWARRLQSPSRTLWVQDAHPLDSSDIDGYLLARRRDRSTRPTTDDHTQQIPLRDQVHQDL